MVLTIRQVIQKTGLCIRMYDLLKVSDGLIGHGDGFVNINGKKCGSPEGQQKSHPCQWTFGSLSSDPSKGRSSPGESQGPLKREFEVSRTTSIQDFGKPESDFTQSRCSSFLTFSSPQIFSSRGQNSEPCHSNSLPREKLMSMQRRGRKRLLLATNRFYRFSMLL